MKAEERLSMHYEFKYGHASLAAPARRTSAPRDRSEACASLASGGSTLLDVGAGTGSVALALRPYYERVIVTELLPAVAEPLRGLGFDVHVGPIESGLPLAEESVDTLILNAVIEHLIDPIGVLTELRALLKPGGEMIITTPNIASWRRRVKLICGRFPSTASRNEGLTTYEGTTTDLYDEGHLHYFSFRSLEAVLARCDLVAERRCGYPGRLARAWPTLWSFDACVVARRPRRSA
jgi:SAM-dependent methyltransferase